MSLSRSTLRVHEYLPLYAVTLVPALMQIKRVSVTRKISIKKFRSTINNGKERIKYKRHRRCNEEF